MAKLFVGSVSLGFSCRRDCANCICSGLAWHTDDTTLRAKFEEYGQVEEAVRKLRPDHKFLLTRILIVGRREGS